MLKHLLGDVGYNPAAHTLARAEVHPMPAVSHNGQEWQIQYAERGKVQASTFTLQR